MPRFGDLAPSICEMLPYYEARDFELQEWVQRKNELTVKIQKHPGLASLETRPFLPEPVRLHFSPSELAFWLVSRSYNSDVAAALADLERLADADHYELVCCVTLAGIKLAPAVRLTDDIRLAPASDLPEEVFNETPPTDAALVKSIVITSPLSGAELRELLEKTKEELRHCAYALCLADSHFFAPIPVSAPVFTAHGYPGRGLSRTEYLDHDEPTPMSVRCIWPSKHENEVREIVCLFLSLPPDVRSRYEVGLQRFADAKRRGSMYEGLLNCTLDLGIALDSLFLAGGSNTDISYRLQIRIAKLLSKDVDERLEISKRVKDLYGMRSKSAHGAGRKYGIQERDRAYDQVWRQMQKGLYKELARDAIVNLIKAEVEGAVQVGEKESWDRFDHS